MTSGPHCLSTSSHGKLDIRKSFDTGFKFLTAHERKLPVNIGLWVDLVLAAHMLQLL
jgi:hypothetical protein